MFGAFSSFCPNSLLKRRQEAASVFCVGAATRASVSAPHNRRNPLGSEVFAGPGCQWPVRRPPPHPPIPPSTTPPADPPAGHGSPHPCFCLHRVESTQRTLRARLSCIGGRPRAGGPPQLAGAQYRTGPAPPPSLPPAHTPTPLQRPGHNGSTHRLLREQAVATRRFQVISET